MRPIFWFKILVASILAVRYATTDPQYFHGNNPSAGCEAGTVGLNEPDAKWFIGLYVKALLIFTESPRVS